MKGEQLTKAVDELMGNGEEAEERRKRARELRETARSAAEEGGSSYENIWSTKHMQSQAQLSALSSQLRDAFFVSQTLPFAFLQATGRSCTRCSGQVSIIAHKYQVHEPRLYWPC